MKTIDRLEAFRIATTTDALRSLLFAVLALFTVLSLHSQAKRPPSTFEILPGSTRQVTSINDLPIEVDYFILGENSTLVIDISEVSRWRLTAAEAYIGKNVRIVGKQGMIAQAARGANGRHASADCKAGSGGGKGQSGKDGSDGLSLFFSIGIVSFGSLEVDVSGGVGQQGGKGGKGGNGGKADISELCKGGDGGRGGDGGDGGDGSDGGVVEITWWEVEDGLSKDQIREKLATSLRVIAQGGTGGDKGEGGPRGEGGPSKCTDLLLAKICRGSGSAGARGSPGVPGDHGKDGPQIRIEMIERDR